MTDIVNLNKPTDRIWLSDLAEPCELLQYCRAQNIKYYAYSFGHKADDPNTFWKFGQSGGKMLGERIYRQAAHLPGWSSFDPRSGHGDGILGLIREYATLYPSKAASLHKDDMFISIWNVTHLKNYNADANNNAKVAEYELYYQYLDLFDVKPFGNLRAPSIAPQPSTAHLDTLFET
jgi:hypothetical protein